MSIDEIDWHQEWIDRQKARRAADNSEYWNMRAHSFYRNARTSPYASEFMRLANVQPGETILDMGCGSGTLAIPYARAGHEVYACDFSQTMLDILDEVARNEGLSDRVHTKLVSWDDDWDAAQMPQVDVALASRSMAADDMLDAINKIESRARRRVCCTLGTNESPRIDPVLMRAVGRPEPGAPEFIYAMNMLWSTGRLPELSNITSLRQDLFEQPEDAIAKHAEIMELSPQELELLRAYTAEHMVSVQTEDGERWRYDHERMTNWAFISWDVARRRG